MAPHDDQMQETYYLEHKQKVLQIHFVMSN